MLDAILAYFDLYSAVPPADRPAAVWPQYAIVAAAVLVEPYLRAYIETGKWDVDLGSILGRTIFALIITIAILPAVYRGAFDPDLPISIQLMTLFMAGLGWRTLFDAGAKAVGR